MESTVHGNCNSACSCCKEAAHGIRTEAHRRDMRGTAAGESGKMGGRAELGVGGEHSSWMLPQSSLLLKIAKKGIW